MLFAFIAGTFLAATFAIGLPQSPLVGKWQTRVSRVTHKSNITVNIVEQEQRLGGAVVLVNPDASEIQLPTGNVNITENVIEFETHDKNDTFLLESHSAE
jgi:starvation-inducible outer membrane lipoprotein